MDDEAKSMQQVEDGKRVDTGAQGTASLANPRLAAMGPVNRAKVGRGTRQGSTKQL